jgi:hypothetical protein
MTDAEKRELAEINAAIATAKARKVRFQAKVRQREWRERQRKDRA